MATKKPGKSSQYSLPILGQRAGFQANVEKLIAREKHPEKLSFRLSAPEKLMTRMIKCAFSIPAGPAFACPGATQACINCYAQDGNFNKTNVQQLMVDNWLKLRWYEERGDIDGAAHDISRLISTPIFRIHESGDFHSQWSVDLWTKITSMPDNRNIAFWVYTRSFQFDYTRLLANPNIKLWASTDAYNRKEAERFVARYAGRVFHAYGPWDEDVPLPRNSFVCPATFIRHWELVAGRAEPVYAMPVSGRPDGRPGACNDCRLCLPDLAGRHVRKNVVFFLHSGVKTRLMRLEQTKLLKSYKRHKKGGNLKGLFGGLGTFGLERDGLLPSFPPVESDQEYMP